MATNNDMRDQLQRVETKVDGLGMRMDGFETKVDGLGIRMDGLETKVDGLGIRMDGLDTKVNGLETTTNATRHDMTVVAEEMGRLSDRMYGVEDRLDAMNTRIDVTKDELRGDIRLALERIDGLREFMERKAAEGHQERAADHQMLYALVKDHNRRLRALERLERRQRTHATTH